MSSLSVEAFVTSDDAYSQDWILDFGASFHVTPHKTWFTTNDNGMHGCVHLGNNYACDIVEQVTLSSHLPMVHHLL